MSLVDSLDALSKISHPLSKEAEEVRALRAASAVMEYDERCAKAYELKMRGKSVQAIAQIFECGVSTVYRWLTDHKAHCRARLEQIPAADIVAETIEFYERIEEICLHEINVTRTIDEEVDPTTGKVRVKGKAENFEKMSQVKFVQAALKARSLKTDLLKDVGLLPKQPEQIYHTLRTAAEAEEAKAAAEAAKASSMHDKGAEELRSELLELLSRGRKV